MLLNQYFTPSCYSIVSVAMLDAWRLSRPKSWASHMTWDALQFAGVRELSLHVRLWALLRPEILGDDFIPTLEAIVGSSEVDARELNYARFLARQEAGTSHGRSRAAEAAQTLCVQLMERAPDFIRETKRQLGLVTETIKASRKLPW